MRFMIIDFHYHYLDNEGIVESLICQMDEAGVDITSVCALEDLFWMNTTVGTNKKVEEAVLRYPERISGCIYIDPRKPDACNVVDEYADKGFRCVKMFPPIGFNPEEDQYFCVYEKIAKRGLPILFHTGQTGLCFSNPRLRQATDSFCAHPMRLDKVAKAFPEISIVLAHMGYPNYLDAWSVAWVNTNVYLDIAGIGIDNPWISGVPLVYSTIGKFIPIDFKRVIWGSDNCSRQKYSLEVAEKYLAQIGCNAENLKYIFGETAKKLLNIN